MVPEEERGGGRVVSQARCSRHAGGMVVRGKGGKGCLVTTDRFRGHHRNVGGTDQIRDHLIITFTFRIGHMIRPY